MVVYDQIYSYWKNLPLKISHFLDEGKKQRSRIGNGEGLQPEWRENEDGEWGEWLGDVASCWVCREKVAQKSLLEDGDFGAHVPRMMNGGTVLNGDLTSEASMELQSELRDFRVRFIAILTTTQFSTINSSKTIPVTTTKALSRITGNHVEG